MLRAARNPLYDDIFISSRQEKQRAGGIHRLSECFPPYACGRKIFNHPDALPGAAQPQCCAALCAVDRQLGQGLREAMQSVARPVRCRVSSAPLFFFMS